MAKKALLEQQLRDLDGVGGSALADLVAAAPEVQTALVGQVLTNAADIDDVLIGRVERHGVDLVLEVVDELAARGVCDELLGTLDADLLLRAQHDGYAVAGTRAQVQLTFISGRWRILRPSFCIFISSLV